MKTARQWIAESTSGMNSGGLGVRQLRCSVGSPTAMFGVESDAKFSPRLFFDLRL
jgi:hypothetical protein